MRSITWITITIITILLVFTSIIRGYSEVDVVAIAMLISISTYVLLRYVLLIYLELPPRSMVSLSFRYIETVVHNGILFTLLSLTIDSLTALVYPRSFLSTILSAIIAGVVLGIAKRFFRLKVLLIIVITSILVLATLYTLGYIKEELVLFVSTTHVLRWYRL